MAREQRKDVDYFPHECTHGRKMHIIETKYGNDGYATWFKLLEQLGKANNHYIDISDEMTLMFLTSTFKIDEKKTISILTDLSKLGGIDKFLFDEYRIIWSEKFCNSIEDAYRKRKQKLFLKDDILRLKNSIPSGNASIPGGLTEKTPKNIKKEVNTAESIRKEEYSIVKESKEEKRKEESTNVLVDLKNQLPTPNIDFDKLLSFFNSNRGLLPEVKKMSDSRKKRIQILEKQYGKESIQTVILKTKESLFLQGDNKESWTANFDWIFKPANFLKILEDNYENRRITKIGNSSKSDADHKQSAVNAVNAMYGITG
ncbi:MAG: DUF4373 domain-containing protein [Methylotenera sp.]|nr:DUF4373 domain-containing protein [Flavobacterium sp.]